jgi:hypothetical protein
MALTINRRALSCLVTSAGDTASFSKLSTGLTLCRGALNFVSSPRTLKLPACSPSECRSSPDTDVSLSADAVLMGLLTEAQALRKNTAEIFLLFFPRPSVRR